MNGNEGCLWQTEMYGDDWVWTFQPEVESWKLPWARICQGPSPTFRFRSIWVTGQSYLGACLLPVTWSPWWLGQLSLFSEVGYFISQIKISSLTLWECRRTFQACVCSMHPEWTSDEGSWHSILSPLMPSIAQLQQPQTSQYIPVYGRGGIGACTTAAALFPALFLMLWVCLFSSSLRLWFSGLISVFYTCSPYRAGVAPLGQNLVPSAPW